MAFTGSNKTRSTRKATRRNVRSVAGKPVARLTAPVRNAVAQVARRAVAPETKMVSLYRVQSYNSTISGAADMNPLIPGVNLGVDDYQRTGEKIIAKGLYVKGSVTLTQSNTDLGSTLYKPLRARMMIIRPKQFKSQQQINEVAAGPLTRLLKPNIGGSSGGQFDGATYSLYYPINKEEWDCCYDKQFTLYPQASEGNTGTFAAGIIQNRMSPGYYQFNKKVPVKKHLLFQGLGAGSSVPTNDAWYMVIGYSYIDQSAIDTLTTQVRTEHLSTLYFTDA